MTHQVASNQHENKRGDSSAIAMSCQSKGTLPMTQTSCPALWAHRVITVTLSLLALWAMVSTSQAVQAAAKQPVSMVAAMSGTNPFSVESALVMTHGQFEDWLNQQWGIQPAVNLDNHNPKDDRSGLHPASLTNPGPLQATLRQNAYVLGPGDHISLSVYQDERFSRKDIEIGTDGLISLPWIGEIQVSGKTTQAIINEVEEALKAYLVEPKADVVVNKPRRPITYVLGAVSRPGPYLQMAKEANIPEIREVIVSTDYHLSTALANAGGATDSADLRNVHVVNTSTGQHRLVNLMALLLMGRTDQDLILGPNDVVYLPRTDTVTQMDPEALKLVARSNMGAHTMPVRIYGLVREPNVYDMEPEQMSLQALLAKAKGPLPEANLSKIYVARTQPDGSLQKMLVDSTHEDVMLHSNDIVMVTNVRTANRINGVFSLISRMLGPAVQGSFLLRNIDQVWPIDSDVTGL
jgi:protein involved in polysaccharide export with SLBB domain